MFSFPRIERYVNALVLVHTSSTLRGSHGHRSSLVNALKLEKEHSLTDRVLHVFGHA